MFILFMLSNYFLVLVVMSAIAELKNDVRSVLTPICFVIMFMLYLCSLYLFTHPKRLPYRIMLVLLNRNTTDVTSGAGSVYPSMAPEFIPSFQWSWCRSMFNLCSILSHIVMVLSFYVGYSTVCLSSNYYHTRVRVAH
jgi:hypothetical protein